MDHFEEQISRRCLLATAVQRVGSTSQIHTVERKAQAERKQQHRDQLLREQSKKFQSYILSEQAIILLNDQISAVETKQVNLEYFLSDKDTYPFSTQVITMTVETYEIIYDLQTGDEMIELGNIPVGSSISKTIVLRNLGPYEFKFM